MGGCCHPDLSCSLTTEAVCDGIWRGSGTNCDDPCSGCCYDSSGCTQAACTLLEDCITWFDPDPQPPYPGTFTGSDCFAIDNIDSGGHQQFQYKVQMPAPAGDDCEVCWIAETTLLECDGITAHITQEVICDIVPTGETETPVHEVLPPGTSGGCPGSGIQSWTTAILPGLSPFPTGVCCRGFDPCSVDTQCDCEAAGGTYQGDDTILSDYCGACCLNAFTCADFWCQDFCEGFGGISHPGLGCGDVDCSL